ncbi:hypothetical protein L209DRAFT_754741 [Thermothelomyces heterothallicus CBS 203.75]
MANPPSVCVANGSALARVSSPAAVPENVAFRGEILCGMGLSNAPDHSLNTLRKAVFTGGGRWKTEDSGLYDQMRGYMRKPARIQSASISSRI